MAVTTRQSNLFAAEDWKRLYTTFRTADFQSYDYETLRKSMVDYLRTYYPEDFNDYIESSEFIAMLDLLAFMGQSISFRGDLNARENFLSTAERRDSVYRLAAMVGYNPKRHINSSGLLKIVSVNSSEILVDSAGRNLANKTIYWDDPTNLDWQEQFTMIMNAALQPGQRISRPAGSLQVGDVVNELYQLRLRTGLVPVFPFSATINNISYPFEAYNIGLSTERGIYEVSPQVSDSFGILLRNDGRGNSSGNTGFFLGFKQGQLNNLDFTLTESLPNRLIGLNLDNINNNDVWLYSLSDAGGVLNEWTKVNNFNDSNIIYNTQSDETRSLYSVSSRINDQIDLIFGDGIFSDIPVGKFRATVRVSNGIAYNIPPTAMQSINITLAYISKNNRIESLSIRAALQYTVNNAEQREELAEIKANAPQHYYTQSRMINGQDYNVFPYSKFNEITKIKSVNRTASGISRFLDVKDVTGKYSSTNVFCDDGYIYKTSTLDGMQFVWNNLNDIRKFVRNEIKRIVQRKSSQHLYYNSNQPATVSETYWVRGTVESGVSTGYFSNQDYTVYQIGEVVTSNRKYLLPGSLVKFEAPEGYYFNVDGNLSVGTPSQPGQTTEQWATIVSVVDDGTNNNRGLDDNGVGPVVISKNIPTDAIVTAVYAVYNTDLPVSFEQTLVNLISTNQDFGIRYDIPTLSWQIISPSILDLESEYNVGSEGTSWVIAMINNGLSYSVYYRGLEYIFGSVLETRFYFDRTTRIYDPKTNLVIKDTVKFLRFNDSPDGNGSLGQDYAMEVYDTIKYPDGYNDDTIIKVTYADSDNDGVPDDPTIFDKLVGAGITIDDLDKLVFFEKYLDFDNLERFRWKDPDEVSVAYANVNEVELYGKYSNPVGTVFYAYDEQQFYILTLVEDIRTIQSTSDYYVTIGRSDLRFQYKHNSPNDRRIDPSPSNIIDMYILTSGYDRDYRRYLKDITGSVTEPTPMSAIDMALAFQDLENYKATSDAIVYNPVKYKPLFGTKSEASMQATFKVVRSETTKLTNTQIRSKIINTIDKYFAVENWDFGDTFYFSELAAYLHQEMMPDVAAIVIVPKSSSIQFSDFMQINAKANELLISAATVDDVELIDAITASKLQATPSATLFGGYSQQFRTTTGG
jgi:hypothetical protein